MSTNDVDLNAGFFGDDPPPIGHNNPPVEAASTAIALAEKVLQRANILVVNIPIIKDEMAADTFGKLINELGESYRTMEKERDAKVRPLNEQVKAINDSYRPAKATIDDTREKLHFVLRNWLREKERVQKAEAQRLADEAERKRRDAEEAQRRAAEEAERAKDGDITDGPIDTVGATLAAQDATLQAHIATATANKAAKAPVSSGGVKLKEEERPSIANAKDLIKVVRAIGMEFDLVDNVMASVRKFKRAKGTWPNGITVTMEKV